MYKLYYYPLNASLAPHFILEELSVEFQLILVDRKNNAQKSEEYLALNPAGRIPTLINGQQVIFESAAICVSLAESHPKNDLIPALNSHYRPVFHQWMMYLTNTLQAELMIYFYPGNHVASKANEAMVISHQQTRIAEILKIIDKTLAQQRYLVSDSLSACDFFLLMLLIWADELDSPPLSFANLAGFLKHMTKRKSVIAVCQKEKIDLAKYLN
ncbi:MAG: glutathione S-transferase family protein [Kangiellaceae bacterium]|nr:glutathione S-transferase family protein [Kangiellaceae bacterium]